MVGRCELIPPNEREAKPEGPFAGLDCVVIADGLVADESGNVVGVSITDSSSCDGPVPSICFHTLTHCRKSLMATLRS